MNLDMMDGSSRTSWRSSWQTATRCSFCSGVRSLGMNFAATWCMFKSHVRIVCTVPYDTLMIAAMSFMVLRWSSCISCQIVSTFLCVELVEDRPDLSSSLSDVLPLLKHACHSKHLARLMASFPYARCIISEVSAPDLPSFKQNLMFALCSSFTSIWNCKCEGTRGDKHLCCVIPNVHTAMPLAILSDDVPCSQAQRTHWRTTIGWRSMELVLKLFDTPMYPPKTYYYFAFSFPETIIQGILAIRIKISESLMW